MAYSDLNSQVRDGDYFIIEVDGLDVDTDYLLRFAWVFTDKEKDVSPPSNIFEFKTIPADNTEVSNVQASWEGTTLKVTWDKTNDRAKGYQIYLTNSGTTSSWTQSVNLGQTQQVWRLSKESNRANFGNIFRTSFTGFLKTTYLNGTTSGVSFTVPEYADAICSLNIGSSDWSVTSIANGFTASWDINSVDYPTYKYTEVWVEDPDTLIYSREYSGIGPATIKLTSFAEHNVKIKHFSESSCSTPFSDIKIAKAFDNLQNDVTPPDNDFNLGTATVTDDTNGLFSFDKKVLFTWTENSSTDTAGYRIRFRINGSSDPYTYMSVPGKEKTSTYLYGLKGGQTYEIGVSTFDVYGNTNETQWRTYSPIVAPLSTELEPDVAITAGDMKLGYGIGGNNSQKGLYLGPENYWYIQGNTTVSSAARVSIGGTNDKLVWDGSNLTATGTINANAGVFTGVVNIGTSTVNGQLNLYAGANKFEIGRLKDTSGNWLNEIGIQGTNAGQKYFQIDTDNGVLVNKGTIGGWTIDTNTISKNYTSLNSDGSITAGSSGEFTVTQSGALTATGATIMGTVRASSGGFGTLTSNLNGIEKGWEINAAKLVSTGAAVGLTQIELDGEEGSITGGRIYGTTIYIDNPNDNISPDYISSSGDFKLGSGKVDYSKSLDKLTVKANLVASNLYIGQDELSDDYIKQDGTFRLANGKMVYDGNNLVVTGTKLYLDIQSNEDGNFSDSTIVQDEFGQLTTGRAFQYGGGDYPTDPFAESSKQAIRGRAFVKGDIWLSTKA